VGSTVAPSSQSFRRPYRGAAAVPSCVALPARFASRFAVRSPQSQLERGGARGGVPEKRRRGVWRGARV
jgi:hypothetical protein